MTTVAIWLVAICVFAAAFLAVVPCMLSSKLSVEEDYKKETANDDK